MSNLPAPRPSIWTQFSADPRTSNYTRASDADRDLATRALNAAFSEGRLDAAEHSERLSRALAARQLGEFVPLLSDLPDWTPPVPIPRRSPLTNPAILGWLGLAVLFNLIWLFTWLPMGRPYYYWPMWPMLGTAIPMMIVLIDSSRRAAGGQPSPPAIEPGPWPRNPSQGDRR